MKQRAVSTAAFALIAPALLLIIFGTAEAGRVFYTWMIITNEAAEAARYGAVHYDDGVAHGTQESAIRSFVSQRLTGVLAPSGLVSKAVVTTGTTPTVAVTLTYNVDLVVPIVAQVLPNPFPLAARAVVAAELES
jgi:Flp pilus assembly protein TadG